MPLRLTSVVIPATSNDELKLETLFFNWYIWNKSCPKGIEQSLKKLVISVDFQRNDDFENKIRQLFSTYYLEALFSNVTVLFCDLRPPAYTQDPDTPDSNTNANVSRHFFKTLQSLSQEEYILIHPLDAYPCRHDWLDFIGYNIFWHAEFLTLNASRSNNDSHEEKSLTGQFKIAIYATGNRQFQEYLKLWEYIVTEHINNAETIAYWKLQSDPKSIASNQLKGDKAVSFKTETKNMLNNASFITSDLLKIAPDLAEIPKITKYPAIIQNKDYLINSLQSAFQKLQNKSILLKPDEKQLLIQFTKKAGKPNLKALLLKNNFISEPTEDLPAKAIKSGSSTEQFQNTQKLKTKDIIFLLGIPRSGTTLTQKMIATSPNIATTGEPWIQLYLSGLQDTKLSSSIIDTELLNRAIFNVEKENQLPNLLKKLKQEFALNFYSAIKNKTKPSACFFLDKTPRYAYICNKLARQYPDAKFLILTRNPFEIACSVISSWTKSVPAFLNTPQFVADFEIGLSELYKFINNPPKQLFLFSYKDITQQPEQTLANIANFLCLDPNEFSVNYANSTIAFAYGDQKLVYTHNRPVDNPHSWKSAIQSEHDYQLITEFLEKLPTPILDTFHYTAHTLDIHEADNA